MGAETAVAPPQKGTGPDQGAARPPGGSRRARDDRRAAWLFLAPALIGFALFYAYPTVRGFYYSLTDYNLLSDPVFTGVDNYRDLIGDEQFFNALKVTGYYVVLNIGSQTVLGLLLATLMHRLTRSVALRAMLLVPWLVPNVTVGLLWMWLLDANLGFVNHVLDALGFGTTGFFTSPTWAMPTVAAVNTWAYTGYTALLLYAGMLQIPHHLYESASLDGAGEWRMFTRITLPLLRPVLALVLVVSLIGSFQIFDTIAVTTKGGPVSATRVIYFYIYEQAFTNFHMGYASAVAVVLAVVLGALTAVQMRLLRASRSDLA
ncbi:MULTISPECIES: carbohydrate ABC transporter permease [Streptomyces]|uniref:Sugar ABC transporter permease n=1 Tax=Streptomyces doudnae TaxID=3075536 RepID=A0ABD5F0E4_9ACTN|nr:MULTISPECIES: sugar ABC transporter permease [unclassified Streptomyces]MDT0440492.1 sugar ABC transporter permease [Streptomyces sp. DSM 41981]MYQ64893.1 ABC transporter permease subunit [Streptomyces sp. SID4950]SCD88221.1 carbohydrate ABC transporter membrane protein 1, CUT1 family [Streptomyces sp. SolWspMP-5a-2]